MLLDLAGRHEESLEAVAGLRELADRLPEVGHGHLTIAIGEVTSLLALGRLEEAARIDDTYLSTVDVPQNDLKYGQFAEARIALCRARDRFEEAFVLIDQLRNIERRRAQERLEARFRSLLRDAEIGQVRLEATRLRERAERLAERVDTATRAARIDPLTGLANRRALNRQFQAWLGAEERRPLAVAVIDLDHFQIDQRRVWTRCGGCCPSCPGRSVDVGQS